jgi:hypothetical protein
LYALLGCFSQRIGAGDVNNDVWSIIFDTFGESRNGRIELKEMRHNNAVPAMYGFTKKVPTRLDDDSFREILVLLP